MPKPVTLADVQKLHLAQPDSHKGQNGKLLIIGGSHLFHAASLWALEVASRLVDLVHYSSVPENNEITREVKKSFRDGIVIPRDDIDDYIKEDDVILIGPGMTRDKETLNLTAQLLKTYPEKQWVLDAGAIQTMDITLIPERAIMTPHRVEFESLCQRSQIAQLSDPEISDAEKVKFFARTYQCIVLLKGATDLAVSGVAVDEQFGVPGEVRSIDGGNAGMTKGGTGDVLAGLIAALACKNDPFLAVLAGSYINKAAGDELHTTVGQFFNASDLAGQIPKTMGRLLAMT